MPVGGYFWQDHSPTSGADTGKKKYNMELDKITLRKTKRRLGKVHIPKHLKDFLKRELDAKKPELLKYQKRYERNIQKIKALYVFMESTMDFLRNPMNLFLHDVKQLLL
jgi:hypothetical protein